MTEQNFKGNNWIKFLASYDINVGGANLFDEKVAKDAKKLGVEEISLKDEYVENILKDLHKVEPVIILIAGVAGDGKSHHSRQIWEMLNNNENEWITAKTDPKCKLTLENGDTRNIRFVRDLSAIDNKEELEKIIYAIKNQNDSNESLVIACNHGAILGHLRSFKENDLANKIEDQFFNSKELNDLIKIYDLSKISQDSKLEEIIRKICTHSGWSICESCWRKNECPILKNRNLLWDSNSNKCAIVAKRLSKLVKLVGYDGVHIPIRELIFLVVNSLLGVKKSSKKICDCTNVLKEEISIESGENNLFNNILGINLGRDFKKSQDRIFKILSRFNIGNEPLKSLDTKVSNEFITNDSKKDDFQERLKNELSEKRRESFFTNKDEKFCWKLTSYHHAGDYLKLIDDFYKDEKIDLTDWPQLLEGLNRVFTGTSRKFGEKLVITTAGAASSELVGKMIECEESADRIQIVFNKKFSQEPPDISFLKGEYQYKLTPKKFECLCLFSEGLAFTGVSKDCISDFMFLKSKLIQINEKKKKKNKIKFITDDIKIRI